MTSLSIVFWDEMAYLAKKIRKQWVHYWWGHIHCTSWIVYEKNGKMMTVDIILHHRDREGTANTVEYD